MRSLLLTAIALVMLACAPPLAAQTCTPTTCAHNRAYNVDRQATAVAVLYRIAATALWVSAAPQANAPSKPARPRLVPNRA